MCDNTTAVHTINNMGTSRSIPCDKLVKAIWQYAISRHLWVTATHPPGRFNEEADTESRRKVSHLEWKLNEKIFTKVKNAFGKTTAIDLFASHLNYQIKPFVSFRPDLECFAVNAFLIPWGDHLFYAFPPFNMISKVLQKVHFDQAEGILIILKLPTQPWYSLLTKMLANEPIVLSLGKICSTYPATQRSFNLSTNISHFLFATFQGKTRKGTSFERGNWHIAELSFMWNSKTIPTVC